MNPISCLLIEEPLYFSVYTDFIIVNVFVNSGCRNPECETRPALLWRGNTMKEGERERKKQYRKSELLNWILR